MFITAMRKTFVTLVTAAFAVPAAAPAQERPITRSKLLWATVNICDTRQSPDTVGIRAQMPGSGRRTERMFMRFRVQWFSDRDNAWKDFRSAGFDSGWVSVGSARYRARQSGWTFPFELAEGQAYELRGVVRFEWRRGRKVVRRAVERTRSGHPTAVAQPRRYSAATCVLSGTR